MKENKKLPPVDEERQFKEKVRRIDRFCIGLLVNVAVSITTVLVVLSKLGL